MDEWMNQAASKCAEDLRLEKTRLLGTHGPSRVYSHCRSLYGGESKQREFWLGLFSA